MWVEILERKKTDFVVDRTEVNVVEVVEVVEVG
jgi:hypothetical protein